MEQVKEILRAVEQQQTPGDRVRARVKSELDELRNRHERRRYAALARKKQPAR